MYLRDRATLVGGEGRGNVGIKPEREPVSLARLPKKPLSEASLGRALAFLDFLRLPEMRSNCKHFILIAQGQQVLRIGNFPGPWRECLWAGPGAPPAQVLSWDRGAVWKALRSQPEAECLQKQVSKPGPDCLGLEELP